MGITMASGTATYCAYPPPPRSAHTRSPMRQRFAPLPVATTMPETSSPIQGGHPGGLGYLPCRCSRSARLSAAQWISINTSPSPTTGSATSLQTNLCASSTSIAFIWFPSRLICANQTPGPEARKHFRPVPERPLALALARTRRKSWAERAFCPCASCAAWPRNRRAASNIPNRNPRQAAHGCARR